MKNYINLSFIVLLAMMVLFGCSSKSSENTNNIFKQTAEVKEVISKAVEGTNKGAQLAMMKPYSIEQMKNWIPTQYKGFVMDSDSFVEYGEMSRLAVTYRNSQSPEKTIFLEFVDGAGPMATVLMGMVNLKLGKEFEEATHQGYVKVYSRNGATVYEKEVFDPRSAVLEYALLDRFCFLIQGEKTQASELWGFADQLDPSKIK
jgi:hypothetical protein